MMSTDQNICAFCGSPLGPNASHCDACGQAVGQFNDSEVLGNDTAESWSEPTPAPEFESPATESDRWGAPIASPNDDDPRRWGSPQDYTPEPEVTYSKPSESQKKKSKTWIWIVVAILIISCICVVAGFAGASALLAEIFNSVNF
jgi:hypothetical protein